MKNKLKNLGSELDKNKEVILILTVIWIILFERLSFLIAASGVIVSVAVVLVTDHFLLEQNYGYSYSIGLWTLGKYFARLFYEIILSGFQALPAVLSGKMEIEIINTKTKLKSELLINLLTNCLTLTPGSVTIGKDGSDLKVLTFDPPNEGEDLRAVIPIAIENILKDYEEKSGNAFYNDEQVE